jgi:hypothetical protein
MTQVLTEAPPEPPAEDATIAQRNAYMRQNDPFVQAKCVMIGSMTPELQKQCENKNPQAIMEYLEGLFRGHARNERYRVSKEFHSCKMRASDTMTAHGVRILGLHSRLGELGVNIPNEAAVDIILQSLPDVYSNFIVNYNMSEVVDTPVELINKLKTAEAELKKVQPSALVLSGPSTSGKGKRNRSKKAKEA